MSAPKVHTIPEALAILRIGRTTFWRLRKSGELQVKRVGRRVLVPDTSIEEYLRTDRKAAA